MIRFLLITASLFLLLLKVNAQKDIDSTLNPLILETNLNGKGVDIEIQFYKGPEIYYPLMAIWIENMEGEFIQSLYVAKSIAKSHFNYGIVNDNRWESGPKRIPAALPYWGHKRGIRAEDGYYLPTQKKPIADAYTGATPTSDFILKTKSDSLLPNQFRVLFEINQSWDWNEYWTNKKFPDDIHYKTSAQPAVIYAAEIDLESNKKEYEMQIIGHSHYSGKTGKLYPDLGTLTSALKIADKIMVRIKE